MDRLRLPDGWLARANVAKERVEQGADPNDFASIWRELKSEMIILSNYKCWYCESQIDRDDNAVDHFRPKNRVHEALFPHSGYKWLAFEKFNYRLACTYCNSRRIDVDFGTAGGKADRFPLLDESKRLYAIGNLTEEDAALLDPCEIDDCELLGCQQENGRPCAATEDEIECHKVLSSIEIYHLDRDATCKFRHAIAIRFVSDIFDAQRLFEQSQNDNSFKGEFLKVAKRIQSAISAEAPYSGEMKYLLRGQRSEQHPWMQKLLEA